MLKPCDNRTNDGITVELYYDDEVTAPDGGTLVVIAIKDEREKIATMFPVPAKNALDAFQHPFAYLPDSARIIPVSA